jgi:phage terminase large subunit-like protein
MPRYSAAMLDALPLAGAEWELGRAAARAALNLAPTGEPWTPLPHQTPPEGDWDTWLLLAGRGSGKTDAAAYWLDQHVRGPACLPGLPGGHRVAIVAPTFGDALEACVNGPSGLRAHNPSVRSVQTAGGTFVRWPSGAEAKLFGAYTPEDVERLRAGGNRCAAYCEELAAWRFLDQCWDHLQLGLRLGPHPRAVAATTPKPKPLLRAMLTDPSVAVTRATTHDNPHLAELVRRRLEARFGGSRLGRQELGGELISDIEGALWSYAMFETRGPAPDLARVVVAVDPAVSSAEASDETGILVAGLGVDGRGYVLADRSCRLSPDGWARRVVQAFDDFGADRVVAEVNNGGDLVGATLKTVRPTLPYKTVHASRGKAIRAAPVAALYEQGRITHTEPFPELEDQLCTWTPESGTSPDRLDALVWALTDTMLTPSRAAYVY